jgi:CheY-like chemotaxis protein
VVAVRTTGEIESASHPAPILVAEDNVDARVMFARLLSKAGVVNPIAFAEDGQAAIDYLDAVVQGERPEPVVVLLDLHMPRKTGLDVLRWIRSEGALPTTPVVILTGSAEMDDVRECHNLGAASYLVKPVGFAALSDVLRSLELRWALLPTP